MIGLHLEKREVQQWGNLLLASMNNQLVRARLLKREE
jgi:hypothetical protein